MKIQHWKTALLLIVSLWFASCFDDKGNYDYTNLNQVVITLPFTSATVARGEVLDVIPEVSLNGDTLGDHARYEYLWKLFPTTLDGKEWILGNTRSLYYRMEMPPGQYLLVYSIKDKETDLNWKESINVVVKSEISEGWLLLTAVEEGGVVVADMDICAKKMTDGTYSVLKHILSKSGFPYRKGPRKVALRGTVQGGEISGIGTKIKSVYVLTDEATGWLDYQTFTWKDDQLLRYQMLEPVSDNYTVEKIVCLDQTKVFAFTADHNVIAYNSLTGGSVFGEKINTLMENGTSVDFEVAPFLGGSMVDVLGMLYPYLLYDQTHQQFMRCVFNPYYSNTVVCSRIPDNWGKPTGMDMRYMQPCGKEGAVYALLQDGSAVYQLYKFTVTSGIVADEPYAVDAPHLTDDSHVVFQHEYGYLYYTSGSDLYTYRRDRGEMKVMTMNAPITALAAVHVPFGLNDQIGRSVAIATYDDSKEPDQGGRLTVIAPEPSRPESVSVVNVFNGLGKVKSIDYLW